MWLVPSLKKLCHYLVQLWPCILSLHSWASASPLSAWALCSPPECVIYPETGLLYSYPNQMVTQCTAITPALRRDCLLPLTMELGSTRPPLSGSISCLEQNQELKKKSPPLWSTLKSVYNAHPQARQDHTQQSLAYFHFLLLDLRTTELELSSLDHVTLLSWSSHGLLSM